MASKRDGVADEDVRGHARDMKRDDVINGVLLLVAFAATTLLAARGLRHEQGLAAAEEVGS